MNRSVTDLYSQRIDHISTQQFPFRIHTTKNNQALPLYFIYNAHTSTLMSQIYKADRETMLLVNQLPGIVQSVLVRDILVEELYHTNEIEGVKSTKEQFVQSMRLLQNHEEPTGRFSSLVKTYYRLMSGEVETPKEPKRHARTVRSNCRR